MESTSNTVAILNGKDLFELLPTHGKVVTLDADLTMKHALDALSSHSATCLPVWDSLQQRFVDVFTCADLVDIVLFTQRTLAGDLGMGNSMVDSELPPPSAEGARQVIERCQLRDLQGLSRSKHSPFMMATVDDSMYRGIQTLKEHSLECLPLVDASCATTLLHVLLPEQVLAFIVASPAFRSDASRFAVPLADTVLPHCKAPKTAVQGTSLADCLQLLSEYKLHALPIVDEQGVFCDVISCRDVRELASLPLTEDLSRSVDDCVRNLQPTNFRVHTCQPHDPLAIVIQKLANVEVAQLVCIDERGAVLAVVSPVDVLAFFVTS